MLLVIILMSLLVYLKSITADIYGDVIKWIVMAYIAGNSAVELTKKI